MAVAGRQAWACSPRAERPRRPDGRQRVPPRLRRVAPSRRLLCPRSRSGWPIWRRNGRKGP
eukprot:6496209-Lingulodinium_polyedra.AAC.1